MPPNNHSNHRDPAIAAPWTVAVTGGIGSGKSTVARIFEGFGAHRIDADQIAQQQLDLPEVITQVEQALGSQVVSADGKLDRAAISRLVFSDPGSLKLLESIIHPRVRKQIEVTLAKIARMGFDESSPLPEGRPLILLDIPLLESSPLKQNVDRVLFVAAPAQQREKRVQESRGWSAGERDSREASQAPLADKEAAADATIFNADKVSTEEIKKQCQEFLDQWIVHCRGEQE
jgi:dephospho-CoA kinase